MSFSKLIKSWHIAGILSILILGCTETVQLPPEECSCSCEPPVRNSFGVRIPTIAHRLAQSSADENVLAFITNDASPEFGLLDLKTKSVRYISLADILPDIPGGGADCVNLLWSPYSSNKLYLHCVAFYDSAGSSIYRQNGYFYDLSLNRAIRITPSAYGDYGSESGFQVLTWLKGSSEGADSLFLGGRQIYVPQEDSLYVSPEGYYDIIYQSPSTPDNYIFQRPEGSNGPTYYLNQNIFSPALFMRNGDGAPSWSPSGSMLAFSVEHNFPSTNPLDPFTYKEIWIVDVKKYDQFRDNSAIYRLNFQDLFCTYSFNGIHAEFLTDSTLAVSMHKDGEAFSGLWEITTKGKLIGQLTFNK